MCHVIIMTCTARACATLALHRQDGVASRHGTCDGRHTTQWAVCSVTVEASRYSIRLVRQSSIADLTYLYQIMHDIMSFCCAIRPSCL